MACRRPRHHLGNSRHRIPSRNRSRNRSRSRNRNGSRKQRAPQLNPMKYRYLYIKRVCPWQDKNCQCCLRLDDLLKAQFEYMFLS